MATIAGTIDGLTLLHKESYASNGTRETWLLALSFGAYTGAADDASLAGVGAAIDARARDGKASTLRGAVPVQAGTAGNGNLAGIYFTGASVQALTVSTDALTGNLSIAAGTEITSTTGSNGMSIAVIVDRV